MCCWWKFLHEASAWRSLYTGHVDVRMISKTEGEKNLMIKKSYDWKWHEAHKTFLHYHFHETIKILTKNIHRSTVTRFCHNNVTSFITKNIYWYIKDFFSLINPLFNNFQGIRIRIFLRSILGEWKVRA